MNDTADEQLSPNSLMRSIREDWKRTGNIKLARDRVLEQFYIGLTQVAEKVLKDPDKAKDAVLCSIKSFFEKWISDAGFDFEDALYSYLVVCVRNEARHHAKNHAKLSMVPRKLSITRITSDRTNPSVILVDVPNHSLDNHTAIKISGTGNNCLNGTYNRVGTPLRKKSRGRFEMIDRHQIRLRIRPELQSGIAPTFFDEFGGKLVYRDFPAIGLFEDAQETCDVGGELQIEQFLEELRSCELGEEASEVIRLRLKEGLDFLQIEQQHGVKNAVEWWRSYVQAIERFAHRKVNAHSGNFQGCAESILADRLQREALCTERRAIERIFTKKGVEREIAFYRHLGDRTPEEIQQRLAMPITKTHVDYARILLRKEWAEEERYSSAERFRLPIDQKEEEGHRELLLAYYLEGAPIELFRGKTVFAQLREARGKLLEQLRL